jgi:hypothetical protein
MHLDVVHKILLRVGLDFFSTKLVERYHRKIQGKIRMIDL